jgi:hypothetical protein
MSKSLAFFNFLKAKAMLCGPCVVSYIHGQYELKLQKHCSPWFGLVWFDLIFALKKKISLACNLLLLGGAGIFHRLASFFLS